MGMEKLSTGRHAQFSEHLTKVVVDGIRANVELGSDLGVGRTCRGQARHPFLLRGEVIGFRGLCGV